MKHVIGFVGLLVVAKLLLCDADSQIVIDTSTASFIPFLAKSLRLRCAIEDSDSSSLVGRRSINTREQGQQRHTAVTIPIKYDVTYVTSLVVQKDGVDLCSVTEFLPAKVLTSTPNLIINGSVLELSGERAYLELSWDHPTTAQSGSYTCAFRGYDADRVGVVASGSIVVERETPTIDNVVFAIYNNKLLHEGDVANLKNECKADVANLKTECKADVAAIDTKHNTDIARLESNIANLTAELHDKDIRLQQTTSQLAQTAIDQDAKIATLIAQMTSVFHVEAGVVVCGDIGHIGNAYPTSVERNTLFQTSYQSTPLVHVAIMDGRINKDYTADFDVIVVKTDEKGFVLRCSLDSDHVNSNYYIGNLRVSWVSFPRP